MKKNKLNPEMWRDDLPQMDDNMIWANIEKALEDKKPRRFFIFRISAVFLIVIIALSYLLIKQNRIVKNKNQNISVNTVIYKNENKPESKIYRPQNKPVIKDETLTNAIDKTVVKRRIHKKIINRANNHLATKYSKHQKPKNNTAKQNSNQMANNYQKRDFLKPVTPLRKAQVYFPVYHIVQLPSKYIKSGISFDNEKTPDDHKKLFVMLSSGTGVPFSFTDFENTLLWQQEKADKEKALYGYSFQIQMAKPVYKDLFVAFGLNYGNTVVRLVKKEKTVSVEYFQSDSAYVIKNTNTYLAGKRKKTITTIKTMTYYNNIGHLAIPVDIGYNWSFGKSTITVSTGINIRFSSMLSGNTILPGDIIDRYENNTSRIKKHLGISQLHLALYYSRLLSSRMQIFIGTNGSLALQPDYSIKNSVFSKRYNTVNVFSGLKYEF